MDMDMLPRAMGAKPCFASEGSERDALKVGLIALLRRDDKLHVGSKPSFLRSPFDDAHGDLHRDNRVEVDIRNVAVAGLQAKPDTIPGRDDTDCADRCRTLNSSVAHLGRSVFRPFSPEIDMPLAQSRHRGLLVFAVSLMVAALLLESKRLRK